MSQFDLARALLYLVAMILSLSFHEAAHAFVAYLRGDRTASDAGRLTLNPIAHMDLVGTLILPLLGALTKMPVIGWAKPVPVDPRRLRNPRLDYALVAAAGPFANLLLTVITCGIVFVHAQYFDEALKQGDFFFPLIELAHAMVWVNIFLALFNMIPLPPLDGATVLGFFLPHQLARKYDEYIAPYGFILLLAIVISGGTRWMIGVSRTVVEGVYVGYALLLQLA